jgi:hypothetical protein
MITPEPFTLVTFRFGIRGEDGREDFLARSSNPAVIAEARRELRLPIGQRRHMTGPIERITPGGNLAWSWRHRDSLWQFAELSIELCDALPSYVKAHLDQWLQGGGLFCPWISYVKAEEPR